MKNGAKISAECLTPILYVRDFAEAMNYYTEKLRFEKLWDGACYPPKCRGTTFSQLVSRSGRSADIPVDRNVRAPPAVTDRVHIFQQSTCQIPNPVHS